MTSRKRNKGRDRKAKKAELEAEKAALEAERMEKSRAIVRNTWRSSARGLDIHGQSIECNHGIALVMPDDKSHPVVNFIDALFMYGANENNNIHSG